MQAKAVSSTKQFVILHKMCFQKPYIDSNNEEIEMAIDNGRSHEHHLEDGDHGHQMDVDGSCSGLFDIDNEHGMLAFFILFMLSVCSSFLRSSTIIPRLSISQERSRRSSHAQPVFKGRHCSAATAPLCPAGPTMTIQSVSPLLSQRLHPAPPPCFECTAMPRGHPPLTTNHHFKQGWWERPQ